MSSASPGSAYVGATPAPSQEAPLKASALDFGVRGASGLRQTGGRVTEERLPLLRGMRELLLYREMADNSAIIGLILRSMKTWIADGKWSVNQRRDTPQAAEAAWLVQTCMDDMSQPWDSTIYQGLSKIEYGFSYAEICYKRRLGGDTSTPLTRSQYNDGYIGWRKFAYRSQDTLDRWEFDKDGSLLGMWQRVPPNTLLPSGAQGRNGLFFIPIQKAVLFRMPGYNDNPQGRSALRNAVTDYNDLRHICDTERIGIDRDLAGLPYMQLPASFWDPDAPQWKKDLRTAWKEVGSLIRRDQLEFLLGPAEKDPTGDTGYKFQLLGSGGQRQMDVDKVIRRKESRMAISMLAEFALVGIESGGGMDGGGVVDSKKDAFALSLNAIPRAMASVFNHYAVQPLCRINGLDPADAPEIVVSNVAAPSLQEMGQFIQQVTAAGMLMYDVGIERKLREMADLPQRDGTEVAGNTITGMSQAQSQTTAQEAAGSGIPGTAPWTPGAPQVQAQGGVITNVVAPSQPADTAPPSPTPTTPGASS